MKDETLDRSMQMFCVPRACQEHSSQLYRTQSVGFICCLPAPPSRFVFFCFYSCCYKQAVCTHSLSHTHTHSERGRITLQTTTLKLIATVKKRGTMHRAPAHRGRKQDMLGLVNKLATFIAYLSIHPSISKQNK